MRSKSEGIFELEIVQLTTAGYSDDYIARRLGISKSSLYCGYKHLLDETRALLGGPDRLQELVDEPRVSFFADDVESED